MDSLAAQRLASELIGSSVAGWTPDSVINHGKSAVVLHARRGSDEAALKIFDRELVERFGRRTQLDRIDRELVLKGRTHPHLVRIVDGGFDEDLNIAFVVMEYLPYTHLGNVLHLIAPDKIGPVISQIASAARFLESLQLAHRDIKPDNIAISDDHQRAVLLDLGVLRPGATAGETPITDLEQLNFIGTLQYSSPEYLFRRERDDIEGWRALTFYQLGAVLHDLIMRKRLFAESADPFARLVEAVRRESPVIESADVSPRLIQLAKSCLLKDPALRLQYVSWESFEERVDSDPADELRLLIRRRVATAAETSTLVDPRVAHERRSTIHAVQILQTKLGDLVRHERADDGVFPPMETDETLGPSPECATTTVTFEKSREHLLPHPLRVWFFLALRDRPTLAVRVTAAAALVGVGDRIQQDEILVRCSEIFDGVFEDAMFSASLRTFLLSLINEVQTLDNPAVPYWLQPSDFKTS